MCVIVVTKPNKFVDLKEIEKLWKQNPDGGGITWVKDGKLQVHKTMIMEQFIQTYDKLLSDNRHKEYPIMLHMRIATHGARNVNNVHPFWISSTTVAAHNGILSAHAPKEGLKSAKTDTELFLESIVKKLPRNWRNNPIILELLEAYVGSSKLVFMSIDKSEQAQLTYINQQLGTETVDAWYSNRIGVYSAAFSSQKQYHGEKAYPEQVRNAWNWHKEKKETSTQTKAPIPANTSPMQIVPPAIRQGQQQNTYFALRREREDLYGLTSEIVLIDGVWWCTRCNYTFSVLQTECECWSRICKTCMEIVAMCGCNKMLGPMDTESTSDYYDTAIIDNEELENYEAIWAQIKEQ